MANKLWIKKDGRKLTFPSGSGFEFEDEKSADGAWVIAQAYGLENSFWGTVTGCLLTIGGIKLHEWLKKRKQEKKEKESTEPAEPEEEEEGL